MSENEDILQILVNWRKVLDEVIDEYQRNSDFARRVERIVLENQTMPKQVQAAPDPFAIFGACGEQGLRSYLEALEPAMLCLIVRSYALDPEKRTARWRERKKLAAFITEQVIQRIQQ
jgi:hypothetical protein